jgi:hypothetical protein
MKIEFKQLAQQILGVKPDGVFGKLSLAAARAKYPQANYGQATRRWIAHIIQSEANGSPAVPHKVAVDGWWGPVTEDAAYRMLGHTFERPDEDELAPTTPRCWTPTDTQMIRRFGAVGTNQVLAPLPFPMRLDWDLKTTVNRVSCHKGFQKPLTSALEEIRDHYGPNQIRALNIDRFGGILNVRKKRGGRTWSSHAWGTAIDLWPTANQLAWKKNRAAFAKSSYKPMREAFAKVGLMSLGTCYDFDWMHFQLNP